MGFLGLFFSFKGRINRLQYWVGSILSNTVAQFVMQTSVVMAVLGRQDRGAASGSALGMVGLMLLVAIASLWIAFALTVKRLHDRGRSGWIALVALVPIVGFGWMVMEYQRTGDVAAVGGMLMPMVGLTLAIIAYFFIDLGLLSGVSETNEHGPPPGAGLLPSSGPRFADIDGQPSSLGSAEAALEAAIAERRRAPPRPDYDPPPSPRAAPAPFQRPIVQTAPQGFGRRGLSQGRG